MSNAARSLTRFLKWFVQTLKKWSGFVPPPTAAPEPRVMALTAYASVIIPALNEAKRIAEVVSYALADPATAEVIVVDDSSIDRTAELARQAGATVITSSMLGKGASMQDGLAHARCSVLVYLDGDLAGLRAGIITDICRPILSEQSDFVKANFGRGGGRVTELTAKPMLKVFFPEIAHFKQPLGGIIAARKSLLQNLTFEDGYGVDVGLLLDAHLAGAKIAEVDIGSLEHDSQALQDLTLMANEVGRVIFERAKRAGRLHVEQVAAMHESQRQAASGIEYILHRRKARQRLLLIDMDGTITPARYALELAKAVGQEAHVLPLLKDTEDIATQRERIAQLFKYVHKSKFEEVARELPIRPDVIGFVNQMRQRGFMVGVVSDSYFIGAEIIRKRIFADFAVAHTIHFDSEICTGEVRINPAFLPNPPEAGAPICKSNVLLRFLRDGENNPPAISLTWAIGDNLNDLAMMRLADRAFTIEPKTSALMHDPKITQISSFQELMSLLPPQEENPSGANASASTPPQ